MPRRVNPRAQASSGPEAQSAARLSDVPSGTASHPLPSKRNTSALDPKIQTSDPPVPKTPARRRIPIAATRDHEPPSQCSRPVVEVTHTDDGPEPHTPVN